MTGLILIVGLIVLITALAVFNPIFENYRTRKKIEKYRKEIRKQ